MNKKGFCVKLTPEQKKDLLSDYLSGSDVPELMSKYNCSHGTIYNICKGQYRQKDNQSYLKLVENFQQQNQLEIGWIAGIIDGEGYLGIAELREQGNVRWSGPRISVSSTTACMQKRLAQAFGSGTICLKDKSSYKNQKDVYCWDLASSKECAAFLTVIEPVLIVKKEQAQLVKEFSLRRLRGERYTEWEQEAIERIHALNKRGK